MFLWSYNIENSTTLVPTGRATIAVGTDVIGLRQMVVDDVVELYNVESPTGKISTHKDVTCPTLKKEKLSLAFALFHSTM